MSQYQTVIENYKSTMYRTEPSDCLATGDIVYLDLAEIKSILRYETIAPVLEQFLNDANYTKGLWAVLNQPCDLVHSDASNRRIKSSLFIVPLQGLRAAFKKGLPTDLLHLQSAPSPIKAVTDSFRKYLVEISKAQNPPAAGEAVGAYEKRIQTTIVHPIMESIAEIIKPIESEIEDPNDLLETLVDATQSMQNTHQALSDFRNNKIWLTARKHYDEAIAANTEHSKNIILKSDQNSKNMLAKLCLNQLDSQGIFFYEPNKNISTQETDLAFIIKLDDMLSIKIKKELLDNGGLFSLLMKKRVVSLTENFSDRLLNIMGTYFSKIGTTDVMSSDVLDLYCQVFPETFFVGVDDFNKTKEAKAKSAPKSENKPI